MSESCWNETFSDFSTFSTFKYALLHVKCATNARIVWGMTTQRAPVGANNRYPAPCKSLWGWPESDCSWSHLEVGGRKGSQGWNRLLCSGLHGLTASCQDGEYVFDSFLPAAQTFQHFLPQCVDEYKKIDVLVKMHHQMNQNQSYGAASPSEWSATTVPSASGSPPWWTSKNIFQMYLCKIYQQQNVGEVVHCFFSLQILLNSF